jgi:hypothetical protein
MEQSETGRGREEIYILMGEATGASSAGHPMSRNYLKKHKQEKKV